MLFNSATKIAEIFRNWLSRTRKRSIGCNVYRDDFGAECFDQLWSNDGAGAITRVEHYTKFLLSLRQWAKRIENCFDVQVRCAFDFFNGPQICAADFCVFTLVINVE